MNQDPATYWVLSLSCDVVVEYISIKIVYFHLIYDGLFHYSKSSSSLTMMSQWVGDVVKATCEVTMGK